MDADCSALVGSFPAARAKISNSLYALPHVDGRSAVARRFRDIVRATLRDLGAQEQELSATAREQVRTVGFLQLQLEAMQARALADETSNELEFNIVRLANSLARLRWQLGIGKRKRTTLTPEDALTDAARRYGGRR